MCQLARYFARLFEVHHRAHTEALRNVFLKYASVVSHGEHYMTPEDFIVRFLKLVDKLDGNEVSVTTLARAADTTRDGLISFDEFLAFENLLCTADALYSLAFELFDRDGDGYISFDDFREVLESTLPNVSIPFDFDCDFVSLHFGKDRKRQVSSEDFTQLIHDLNDEHAVQAFKRFDQTHTGTISVTDFNNIMLLLKNHMLTKFVRDNLLAVSGTILLLFR
ncbi:unnamed protein product [Dicrocoelium dendriticum]|nr:unnamed protein product [Dicrocoelium dendriticum]